MPDRAATDRSAAEPASRDGHTLTRPMMQQKERRRTSRFSCVGQAQLVCLPSDGHLMSGKIHDLSLGGCRINLNVQLDPGARTEVVIRANAASFRALGIVTGLREKSEAGIEFVHLSSGGRDLLEDLISELARLRATIDQLMSMRRQISAQAFRKQMEAAKSQAVMFATRFPFLETTLAEELSLQENVQIETGELPRKPQAEPAREERPRVIPINLFG